MSAKATSWRMPPRSRGFTIGEPERMESAAIVDAHQHFWDLQRGRYPWLQDEPPPAAFRYGDTRALRRTYLPEHYAADTRGWRVAATAHVEAEWDGGDPVAETRWLAALRAR